MKWITISLLAVLLISCEEPKPNLTGRLNGPSDAELIKGCAQSNPQCDPESESKHLLVVSNSLNDDLRIFQVESRNFFEAPNPLFPLNIPVGRHPRNLEIDPHQEYAFVVNSLSEDLSLVGLSPDLLTELDTDGNQTTCDWPSGSDRCVLGVTRIKFGNGGFTVPEDIVCPREQAQGGWNRQDPLPVYVSLSGTGQIAVLRFNYPQPELGWLQTMESASILDLGGHPAGMAITRDGATLFAADLDSDSIFVVDTASMTFETVDVGAPSQRVFLTPDESMLYVVKTSSGRVSLVDVESRLKVPPGETLPTAIDPESTDDDIRLPGVARSIAFVRGVPMPVYDENMSPEQYTSELLTAEELAEKLEEDPEYTEEVVKTFAFVSDLNGNVYVIDAVNHRVVDTRPLLGAAVGPVGFWVDSLALDDQEFLDCVGNADCPHPHIAEYDKVYDGESETRPIYHGVYVFDGSTRDNGWSFIYEGVIPGSEKSTSGRLDGFSLEDDRTGLDFVDLGVLAGDILEIQSAVDPDQPDCEEAPIEFVIGQVGQNQLTLEEHSGPDPAVCWPQAVRYQVRAGNSSWVVKGTRTGLDERLYMEPYSDPPPTVPTYDNDSIALTLFAPGIDPATQEPFPIARETTITFSTDAGFINLLFAPSVQAGVAGTLVPVDLEDDLEAGDPGDDRIYLLFEGSNAMMEFFPTNMESSNYILYQ